MVSIRKREWRTSAGKHRMAWLVDFNDADGVRKAKQFATQADARDWVRQTNFTELRDNTVPTVAEVCAEWLSKCEAEGLERGTLREYRYIVSDYIIPSLGQLEVNSVKLKDVVDARQRINEAVSNSMGDRFLNFVKMVFNFAIASEYVGANPARTLKGSKSRRHRKRPTIPSRSAIEAIRNACAQVWRDGVQPFQTSKLHWPDDQEEVYRFSRARSLPMLETLWEAGLRCSEMRALTWPNVNLAARKIEVTQRADMLNEIGDCKTEAAVRTIKISQTLTADLAAWRAVSPAFASELVFPTFEGSVLSYKAVRREFARAQIQAGQARPILDRSGKPRLNGLGQPLMKPNNRVHHLRHYAASWRIAAKMNLKQLPTEMGHSSIQVTIDIYGHLMQEAYGS